MIKCIYDECQWPKCDKTCGMVPPGDYPFGVCHEEKLIYHLQQRISKLNAELRNLRLDAVALNNVINKNLLRIINPLTNLDAEFECRCAETCLHGYIDCVHNPEYIRRNYPEWWIELGMPIFCDPEKCCYDDEDK